MNYTPSGPCVHHREPRGGPSQLTRLRPETTRASLGDAVKRPSGLLGYPAYAIGGYRPDSAVALMINLLCYAGGVRDAEAAGP